MEITQESDRNANFFQKETIDSLSDGLLKVCSPGLTRVKTQLNELTDKQSVLVDQLHNENLKLSWSLNSAELQEMYDTMKLYQGKLINIKKDMRLLHEKSTKLKKRTLRLQQHMEKDAYVKKQQKETEQDQAVKPPGASSS